MSLVIHSLFTKYGYAGSLGVACPSEADERAEMEIFGQNVSRETEGLDGLQAPRLWGKSELFKGDKLQEVREWTE